MKTQKRIATRRATRFLVAAGLFGLAAAGCAHGGDRLQYSRAAGQGDDVTIRADNRNFLDATVYALWNGRRDRLGMVTGKSSQSFDVDLRSNDLQLEIDLVGGGSMTTDRMGVWEGDQVNLVIPPQ